MADHDWRKLEREAMTPLEHERARTAKARAGIPADPLPRLPEWFELYEDLPNGGFWVKDEGDYLETVEVTDLDSASGANGLVMVEARVTSLTFGNYGASRAGYGHNGWEGAVPLTHKYAGVFAALACGGMEPGFALEDSERLASETKGKHRDVVAHERKRFRQALRARIAESMVRYGHADPRQGWEYHTIIVWQGRPDDVVCSCEPKCSNPGERASRCETCRTHERCDCHENYRQARNERVEQRQSWDGWEPTGFEVVSENGRKVSHSEYEGDAGLRQAIQSFGPEVRE